MKIILIKNVKLGFENVVTADEEGATFLPEDEYISLSEVMDVEFKMLPNESVIPSQVKIIDKQMTKVRADAEASITALEGKKQELLSIDYVEE